jgi:hypothetical protein
MEIIELLAVEGAALFLALLVTGILYFFMPKENDSL